MPFGLICKECGKKIREHTKLVYIPKPYRFCPYCGAPLKIILEHEL